MKSNKFSVILTLLILYFYTPAYAAGSYIVNYLSAQLSFFFGLGPFFQSPFGTFILSLLMLFLAICSLTLFISCLKITVCKLRNLPANTVNNIQNLKISFNMFLISLALLPCACGINHYMPAAIFTALILVITLYIIEKKSILKLHMTSVYDFEHFSKNFNLCTIGLTSLFSAVYIVCAIIYQMLSSDSILIYGLYKSHAFKAILSAILTLVLWNCANFFVRPILHKYSVCGSCDVLTAVNIKFENNIYILCSLLNISFAFWGFSSQQTIISPLFLLFRFFLTIFFGILSLFVKFKMNRHEHAYLYMFISYAIFFITTIYFGA